MSWFHCCWEKCPLQHTAPQTTPHLLKVRWDESLFWNLSGVLRRKNTKGVSDLLNPLSCFILWVGEYNGSWAVVFTVSSSHMAHFQPGMSSRYQEYNLIEENILLNNSRDLPHIQLWKLLVPEHKCISSGIHEYIHLLQRIRKKLQDIEHALRL